MHIEPFPCLDFEIMDNPLMLKDGNIVIYGAPERAYGVIAALRAIGANIVAIADHASEKWGGNFHGLTVISPEEMKTVLLKTGGTKYVISCVQNTDEIARFLSELFKNEKISIGFVSYWGIDFCIHLNMELLIGCDKNLIDLFEREKASYRAFIAQGYLRHLEVLSHEDNILVLQPGKVGSSSMIKMLNKSCIHIHRLSFPEWYLGPIIRPIWERTVEHLQEKPCKIISMVRNPLSRGYSAFWQAFSLPHPKYRHMIKPSSDLQKMYDLFMDIAVYGLPAGKRFGVEFPLLWWDEFDWFDSELKPYLGLDVYDYPFDKQKGYTIVRKGNIELFLMQMEKMESAIPALETFLGENTHLNLEKANAAMSKTYSIAYREFRKSVKIKKAYVDHFFKENSKVDHFYSEEDQEKFIKKWEDNIE